MPARVWREGAGTAAAAGDLALLGNVEGNRPQVGAVKVVEGIRGAHRP